MIYLTLFLTFLKIGAFTFGGGYAMLPFIQEAVLAGGWASEAELVNFIAVSESTPGPFAINMATYIGSCVGGVFGAFCATLGVVLPSFVIILIVAKCYEAYKQNRIVKGCMTGLKSSVVGLIGAAVLSIAATALWPQGFAVTLFSTLEFWISAGIFAVCCLLAFRKVHPILIVCLSAACGIGAGFLIF